MAVRILKQAEMHRSRRRVDFCYLCGKDLSDQSRDHVIPINLLRLINIEPERDKWPVILDVHTDCHERKSAVDNWLVPLHRMHLQPPPAGTRRSDHIPKTVFPGMMGDFPVLRGGYGAAYCKGVWTWIRGLHTAIYGEFLPKECEQWVLPPTLAWNEKTGLSQEYVETLSVMIRGTVDSAVLRDAWDGITTWDDKVQYRCTWRHIDGDRWRCCWTLDGLPYPVLFSYGISERPWHGYYCSTCPAGASKDKGDIMMPPKSLLPRIWHPPKILLRIWYPQSERAYEPIWVRSGRIWVPG